MCRLFIALAFPVAESRLWASRLQKVLHMGFVAPQHVRSSQTRDQTGVPCIARRILNHWTTKEAF